LQGLGNWRTVLHIGSVRFTRVKVLTFGAGPPDSAQVPSFYPPGLRIRHSEAGPGGILCRL